MSTGAQVAVLEPIGSRTASRRTDVRSAERPLVQLSAFMALGLYGVLRWGTLLSPAPVGRLLGLLALAGILAGTGAALCARSRPLAIVGACLAALAVLPIAGIPIAWVLHVRLAVTADAIGQGLAALPRALVPYNGINELVRVVTVLGAGLLLLDAALLLAFAGRPLGELRRACAALPLLVLAVVPSTLVRPQLPYVHGLILFVLLAAFAWGDRVRRSDLGLAAGIAGLAGASAMVAAPALDQHSPWLDYQALVGTLSPRHVESFDWSQRYGPLNWPRTGHEVLDVQAQRPDYWKAEDLDQFNGIGWTQGSAVLGGQIPAPAGDALARWTQTIQVTIRAMRTTDVIAAGLAFAPEQLPEQVVQGLGQGTWVSGAELQPGDSYRISTYSPQPTVSELASAGNDYPAAPLAGYRSMLLPQTQTTAGAPAIVFPPFHSGQPVESVIGIYGSNGTALVRASPYGRAFALARRLASSAASPYAFVASVQRLLGHGFAYNENPSPSPFPLASFLFQQRLGYCQQFAGAMALLLRMGGVPARVAVGFTSGRYDSAARRWVVSDVDAHAWVEAWFPHYGWVRFDPTPAAAPARGGHAPLSGLRGAFASPAPLHRAVRRREPSPAPAGTRSPGAQAGGSPAPMLVAIVIALVVLALAGATYRPAGRTNEELLAELERALGRCGRPIPGGLTLAALEQRFRSSPKAAGYIRAIRLARFAGAGDLPTTAQRRALRAQLRPGLGAFGRLRALWALPPNWSASPSAWSRSARGIHFK